MSINSETEFFKLVIPRNGNCEVLLHSHSAEFSLPQVEIPKNRRTAELLTKCLKERWGLDAICLFDPVLDCDASFHRPLNYQVLEPRTPNWIPPSTLKWIKRSSIGVKTFKSTDDFQVLQRSLELAAAFNSEMKPGPFAKAGWIDELTEWMQPQMSALRLSLTGNLKQLNASPFFSLIRFETNAAPVWFKAVGEPNLHEYQITLGLVACHPEYLPRIITTKPEWHGWVMEEVQGTNLNNSVDLEEWRIAVSSLASLQIDLIGRSDWLLEIGCKDRRLSKILDEIDPFLEVMVEVMQRQHKTPPEILTRPKLMKLGRTLKDACHRLKSVEIPDSLLHGDFNPGNVRITSDHRCSFLDWAEGYVGPPFITFEHLLANLQRVHPEHSAWEEPLRNAYAEAWKAVVPSEKISEALMVTPLIAVLSYALSGSGWQEPRFLCEPNRAKYTRGLVRRMYAEAQKQEIPGTFCVSSQGTQNRVIRNSDPSRRGGAHV
jgi:hypothetical protein